MIVYVLVVLVSSDVPMTVIVLLPTFNEIDPEAWPELTAVPLTVIVANEFVTLGVTVTEEVA